MVGSCNIDGLLFNSTITYMSGTLTLSDLRKVIKNILKLNYNSIVKKYTFKSKDIFPPLVL